MVVAQDARTQSALARAAPYTHFFELDTDYEFWQIIGMQKPLAVSGREFRPEVVAHLNELVREQPGITGNTLARETCALLAWYGPSGLPALSSAKVALRKLQKRGVLVGRQTRSKVAHRLRASGQGLPALSAVPRRVD